MDSPATKPTATDSISVFLLIGFGASSAWVTLARLVPWLAPSISRGGIHGDAYLPLLGLGCGNVLVVLPLAIRLFERAERASDVPESFRPLARRVAIGALVAGALSFVPFRG